ncbi:uncharacterized protein C8A04DRAFT_25301 [Dichotomopilus funicola]|uniref:Uncharacterized protein n=1 Tax=Dichotomopilus funicola TaxID=1934379 RepID=A0AAN6V8C4_9PEZI|nr:hypothetical protein C8A04DRAFT_25301 [Dichotomopilus funicola]
MLFPEEHSAHLKQWIVKRLENTSDADPDVLADYVLALLRHDGDINDVRKLCESEIPDFLKEDSPVFVNDVFDAIAHRSYLPGAPPPPPKQQQQQHRATTAAFPDPGPANEGSYGMFYDDRPMDMAVPALPPPFSNGSRKRGYTDWDDPNANVQNGGGHAFGGRPVKQPRRGRRDSRSDTLNKWYREGMSDAVAGQVPYAQGAAGPPATVGYFNPQNGAVGGSLFGMSMATGHPMPDFLGGGHFAPGKKRKKCRDFEKKGFCPRGTSCTFAHGNDSVYGGPPGPPFGGMQMMPRQASAGEEYDPSNALMPDLLNGQGPFPGQMPIPVFGQQQRHRGGKYQNRQRRADKATFSADGPVFDKTKSTIVVENIPEESFTEDQVKSFFSQFGSIVDVSMRPYKRLAVVKFDNWTAANAAYQSPKVIFDNRFVKVFWYKDEASATASSADGGSGTTKPKHARGLPTADDHEAGSQPEIDLDEFAKQQEERQKAFEEKTKRREDLERQREELEKRQQELMAKHLEEKAKLQVKLGGSNGSKNENGRDDTKRPISQTEALRAQLAALEAQAREMGIDPDDPDASASWTPRGGSNGRGRGGSWRGSPSPYTPRGSFRGGYRGRANVHAAYAAYSLDNRPKKVALTGVDFTASDKDETLRQYLFGIGEFTDIHTTPASTEITFKDRKTAEKFYNSVLLANRELPGLDTPVEVNWAGANGAPGSMPTTPGVFTEGSKTNNGGANGQTKGERRAVSANGEDDGGGGNDRRGAREEREDEGDAGGSGDKDVHILLDRPTHGDHHHHRHHQKDREQREMDYEVADEEDQWGY